MRTFAAAAGESARLATRSTSRAILPRAASGSADRGRSRLKGQPFVRSTDFRNVVFADDGTQPGALARVRVIGATSQTLIREVLAPAASLAGPQRHVA